MAVRMRLTRPGVYVYRGWVFTMATARYSLFATPVLALGALGCILLVSPPSGGAHCRFRGVETSCGTCLAERCQPQIDAICIDDPSAALPVVEQCAAASDDACNRIPSSDAGTCLKARCRASCFTKLGKSGTDCEESFLAPELACSCHVSAHPTDLECSKVTYPRTRCCAPAGWPGAALSCTCNAVACVPGTGGCICTLTDNLAADTAPDCNGTHCCAVEDRCQCRPRECSGGEKEVPTCNRDALSCPIGTMEVASCSTRQ